MQQSVIRIGTRESQLAVWQATNVKEQLQKNGHQAELVYIKSEGDIDLKTPLYAMGVQGVFTRSLDLALLNNKIDIAVHSMKDVPIQLPQGIVQAAVLERASDKDILVVNTSFLALKNSISEQEVFNRIETLLQNESFTIGTSSVRRKAQWLLKYPQHTIENLRGNVNTRLKKVAASDWAGAIFAAAGVERIGIRPLHSINLDWMIPAPAQGAIMVVARAEDEKSNKACAALNHLPTAIATKIERDFLSALMGGCATPISAKAELKNNEIYFKGSIVNLDGVKEIKVEENYPLALKDNAGFIAAKAVINKGGKEMIEKLNNA
ncbi:MAG: hydroxymethylbilane synthase [Niabella sp.]